MKAIDYEMKLKEQYEQEIRGQEVHTHKATAWRWIKNIKQGKLDKSPEGLPLEDRGLIDLNPGGESWYPGEEPQGRVTYEKSVERVKVYIQADLEYLENSEEGKQENAISKKPDKEQVKKVKYQDYIKDKNVLKEILLQLALPGNAFIDAETSKNWEQIYENHFKDTDLICSDNEQTRINWIGTWGEYCIFYNRSALYGVFQGRNFDKGLQYNAGTFFEQHFLFNGDYKTNKQACDGYRRCVPDDYTIGIITKILEKYQKSTALTS